MGSPSDKNVMPKFIILEKCKVDTGKESILQLLYLLFTNFKDSVQNHEPIGGKSGNKYK